MIPDQLNPQSLASLSWYPWRYAWDGTSWLLWWFWVLIGGEGRLLPCNFPTVTASFLFLCSLVFAFIFLIIAVLIGRWWFLSFLGDTKYFSCTSLPLPFEKCLVRLFAHSLKKGLIKRIFHKCVLSLHRGLADLCFIPVVCGSRGECCPFLTLRNLLSLLSDWVRDSPSWSIFFSLAGCH